jgi:hypothetical protein
MADTPEEPKETSSDKPPKTYDPRKLRPSEFMRARRPERFADSRVIEEPKLTQAMFEYQLQTLTSRKQETEFEHFTRRLAQREICPNLLPQTGPTGGGDSKVDAETYPVSEEITLRWYEGGTRAGKERWAFAFSAKKDWEGKVKTDIKKIAETGRHYDLAYFITNQFVADKKRAVVEESLEKEFGIPVRILDRTWIVKSIFDHRHQNIAIETLHLTGYENAIKRELGPNDARRETELREFDAEIADPTRYEGVNYQLAEDCLRSALLARGLERTRAEIEGRFARAEQIARSVGYQQQQLRVAYNRAWTTFWWFDDFRQLNALYDDIEVLALASDQADDLERLANLCTLLATSINAGQLDSKTAKFRDRTSKLRDALKRLAADGERPNNALWARTTALLMDLQLSLSDATKLSGVLKELNKVLESTQGLISYPIEPITKIIRELGSILPDNEQYDDLLERVVAITQERASRGEAGRLLLERGFQKLKGNRPYDAIVLFGRAQQLLALREYRDELISALFGAGLAYEAVGLLWAARANTLAAANLAISDYVEEGVVRRELLLALEKLVWPELQLGRIPSVLQWMEAASAVAQHARLSDEGKKRFADRRWMQDGVLAILFLRTDASTLKWLDWMPSLLDHYELFGSWMSLLYALGYEDHLRNERAIPADEGPESVTDFFVKWLQQPASNDLVNTPEFYLESRVVLRSSVLGVNLSVYSRNDVPSILLGERILAALEALLATSLEGVFPHVEDFAINIRTSELVHGQPEYEFDEVAQAVTVIHAPTGKSSISEGAWLQDLLVNILARVVMIKDLEEFGRRVFGEESGFSRAINFSDPTVPIGNILGGSAKFRMSDWEQKYKETFPLRRASEWNRGLLTTQVVEEPHPKRELQPGEGEPPRELLDFSKVKHSQRRIMSLVNIPLWDRAQWGGTIYALPPDSPPILGLGFRDAKAGKAVFEGWRRTLGQKDEEEKLRISIVTGIDVRHPFWYRVVIGSNVKTPDIPRQSHMVMVQRINTMHAETPRNLEGFLEKFRASGRFLVIPVHMQGERVPGEPFIGLAIEKTELLVRPAWKIGPNDLDSMAVDADDSPIIPHGTKSAPVLKLLKKKRKAKR